MAKQNKNLLLVEGKSEQYCIPELMEFHTIWGDKPDEWAVEIKQLNGYQPLLDKQVLSTASKRPGLRALGVILDADDNVTARWDSLRNSCRGFAGEFPSVLPSSGLIHLTPTGIRIGIWIMPDNSSPGMMETFLSRLLAPECSDIWDKAKVACEEVATLPNAHARSHRDKAKIHTYLAWVEPPGRTFPEAIIAKAIDAKHASATPFVSWFMELFELQPRV